MRLSLLAFFIAGVGAFSSTPTMTTGAPTAAPTASMTLATQCPDYQVGDCASYSQDPCETCGECVWEDRGDGVGCFESRAPYVVYTVPWNAAATPELTSGCADYNVTTPLADFGQCPNAPQLTSLQTNTLTVKSGDGVFFSPIGAAHSLWISQDAAFFDECDTAVSSTAFVAEGEEQTYVQFEDIDVGQKFYFICTTAGHCAAGQKLAVTVVADY